jgi:hypothetical protein
LKKLVPIFILSFYLISTTSLRELVKIPVLFQHFFEHKDLNQEITFFTYLVDHYNDIPHTDNDEARDNELPFKSSSSQNASGLSYAVPQFYSFHVKTLVRKEVKVNPVYQEGHIPSICQGKIWQPPKHFIYS